jgi:hypothetical protein
MTGGLFGRSVRPVDQPGARSRRNALTIRADDRRPLDHSVAIAFQRLGDLRGPCIGWLGAL